MSQDHKLGAALVGSIFRGFEDQAQARADRRPAAATERPEMKNPCISIDRAVKRFAIFDGMACIGKFRQYDDDAVALATARAEIALLTDKEREVVYPVVTSVRLSQRRVRK